MSVVDLRDAEIARLDTLVARLEVPEDIDTAIHDTRKGIKRLRAHLRLGRDAIERDAYRSEDAALRDIGRLLAPPRDAFVVGLTLESLEPGGGWEAASAYIAEHHATAIEEFRREAQGKAVELLSAALDRWPSAPLDTVVVGAGLERTYSRGRSEHREAAASEHAEAFHAWRKWAKYLRYQLEAIGVGTEVVAPWVDLGEALGLEHDHTVFIAFCDEHIDLCPDRRDRYVLIDRAEHERAGLRDAAVATGLYEQEPAAFVASVL